MKRLLVALLALALFAPNVCGRTGVKAASTFDSYRPIGETRLWTFVHRDSTLGRLISTVTRSKTIDGIGGFVIEERLGLDYFRMRGLMKYQLVGEQFVSESGSYLGSDLTITVDDQSSQMKLERDGATITGFIERAGSQAPFEQTVDRSFFALGANLLDQMELFLAMRDIEVGEMIEDSVFVPQDGVNALFQGVVEEFLYLELYQGVFDSVFVIQVSQPQQYRLYLTPDHRLVRADIGTERLRAYLDLVRKPLPKKRPAQPQVTLRKAVLASPHIIVYVIVAALCGLFYTGRAYRNSILYVALIFGGIAAMAIPYVQIPVQLYLLGDAFVPSASGGGRPLLATMLPALSAGLIQELLKLGLLIAVVMLASPREYLYKSLGVTVALGFGLVEAAYLVTLISPIPLLSWNLLERLFLILYHVTAGALIGYALSRGYKAVVIWLAVLIAVNSLWRYLPILVQQGKASPEVLSLATSFMTIVLVGTALILFRRDQASRSD
ncbi:MAG: hypothetical protein ACE5FH_10335 [Candidatus Zixiibacteriota bacterium]